MIKPITMYECCCNNCGKVWEDEYLGCNVFNDECNIDMSMQHSDWYISKEQGETVHYCYDCHSWDENDNLVIG